MGTLPGQQCSSSNEANPIQYIRPGMLKGSEFSRMSYSENFKGMLHIVPCFVNYTIGIVWGRLRLRTVEKAKYMNERRKATAWTVVSGSHAGIGEHFVFCKVTNLYLVANFKKYLFYFYWPRNVSTVQSFSIKETHVISTFEEIFYNCKCSALLVHLIIQFNCSISAWKIHGWICKIG